MKKSLLIFLAIIGIVIFFVTKNIKKSLKTKKNNPLEKVIATNPKSNSTAVQKNDSPSAKPAKVENSAVKSKEEEEYEYEDSPLVNNRANHSSNPHIDSIHHGSGETAPISTTPSPTSHHLSPTPVGTIYEQPPAPPVEKLAPMIVKP